MGPFLPDEILVKIIKASIEPCPLYVYKESPKGDNEEGSQSVDEGYESGDEELEEDDGSTIYDLIFCRPIDVRNFLLVNKMFKTETEAALRYSFNGMIIVDCNNVRLLAKLLFGCRDPIKQEIRIISVRSCCPYSINVKPLLHAECAPNLEKIIITMDDGLKQIGRGTVRQLQTGTGGWNLCLLMGMKNRLCNHETEFFDMLQERRLLLRITEIHAEKDSDEVAGIIFGGEPGEDGEYKVFVRERWSLVSRNIADFTRLCERFWSVSDLTEGQLNIVNEQVSMAVGDQRLDD